MLKFSFSSVKIPALTSWCKACGSDLFNPPDIVGLITLLYSGLKPSQVSTLAALDSTRSNSTGTTLHPSEPGERLPQGGRTWRTEWLFLHLPWPPTANRYFWPGSVPELTDEQGRPEGKSDIWENVILLNCGVVLLHSSTSVDRNDPKVAMGGESSATYHIRNRCSYSVNSDL